MSWAAGPISKLRRCARSAMRSNASAKIILRMLRAVRFAARLNFSIEAETLTAIRRLAHCVVEDLGRADPR